jgi:hypothetical protein
MSSIQRNSSEQDALRRDAQHMDRLVSIEQLATGHARRAQALLWAIA